MDKATAGKLLAIIKEQCGSSALTTGADDRVQLYLRAARLLPHLVEGVRESLGSFKEPDDWEELCELSRDLADVAELARLLDSVHVASEE